MSTEKKTAEILAAVERLLTDYSPKEVEDTLFLTFERANLLSDGDREQDRETRSAIHTELRTIFRNLADSPELITKIKNQWKTNITEIT